MNERMSIAAQVRKLGWLTLLAFTAKGVVTTSLLVWGAMTAAKYA